MGWPCGCFDGLRTRRGAGAGRSDLAKQPLPQKQLKQGSPSVAAAGDALEKSERSPRCKAGSEATEEPPISARSEGFSSHCGGTTREPTEEQDVSPSRKTSRRSGVVEQAPPSVRSSRTPRKTLRGTLVGPILPAAAAGKWRYDETAAYQLSRLSDEQWRFDETQDSGRSVSGFLQPSGSWMKGALCFTDTQEECGTIRMTFSEDESIIRSNFRPAGEDWWSGDMVAYQEEQEEGGKRCSTPSQAADESDDANTERLRSGSVKDRRSSSRERTRSSMKNERKSSRGRNDRQVLEMIPTRVKAKLERSVMHSRKRTPSLTRVKIDLDPSLQAMEGDEAPGRRGSGHSSRLSAESTESSIIKEVHLPNMKSGFHPASGERDAFGGGPQEKKPCCSALFQACCRSGGVDSPAEFSEMSVEQSG